MADRVGRRTTFLLANLTLFSVGVISAMSPSFYVFVALRGVVGLAIGGIIIPFDNLAESVEEKYTVSVNYFWSFGSLFVSLVAAAVMQEDKVGSIDSWRILTVICSLPIFLACLVYFYIEESPLWLQDVGRDEEALAVLQRIACQNGKDISGVELVPYEREAEPTCTEVFSRKLRMRTVGLALIWFGGVLGYYGASLATPEIFGVDDGSTNYSELIFGTSGEIVGVFVVVFLSTRLLPCRCPLHCDHPGKRCPPAARPRHLRLHLACRLHGGQRSDVRSHALGLPHSYPCHSRWLPLRHGMAGRNRCISD